MSLANFVNTHGADGLKNLTVKLLKMGDPDFDHARSETKIGLSDPKSCKRKRQWGIQYGDLIEFESTLSLLVGIGIHKVVQDLYVKHFPGLYNKTLFIEYPISIKLENNCFARSWIDIFFDAPNPQDRIVIDIKTTNKTEENYKQHTLPNNIAQLNTYIGAVKAKKGYLIVFYLNKLYETLDKAIEVIEIGYDDNLYRQMVSDLNDIFRAIQTGGKADCKFDRTDCAYCPFKTICEVFMEFLFTKIKNPYVRKDYDPDTQYIMNQITYNSEFSERVSDITTKNVVYNLKLDKIKEHGQCLLRKMEEKNLEKE